MDIEKMRAQLSELEAKRDVLVQLLEKPDLGALRLDVDQALEELDDLLMEFKEVFPAG
ncbi:MAG: hypothetical protein AAFY11_00595 [Cyanobacteria bacterium J06641_5]